MTVWYLLKLLFYILEIFYLFRYEESFLYASLNYINQWNLELRHGIVKKNKIADALLNQLWNIKY